MKAFKFFLKENSFSLFFLVRDLGFQNFNHFVRKVSYPQLVDILALYVKSDFFRFHCFRLMLKTMSKLTLPAPIPNNEKKKNHKTFIKPFEAPQRSVKIKI